ncbi:hypothetical protein Voc01_011000 [Virgisporangium ochraceum]|uniref:Glycosyltransferase RgtA/B/C/D-like domain-containing protein n=1 Tax=Virgisporangium ochraceum TaxID=65505 RepID=A0A8J3ZNM4_9ACTN|nr:hypothetical protein Voc01_011000 [Virgisporangium ochraceum]
MSLVRRVPKKRRVSLRKRAAQQPGKWRAFAPTADRPGPITRSLQAIGRSVFHEYTLATLGSVLLAVIMTWPTMRYPTRTVPQDLGDPLLQAWQLAWSGHALDTKPSTIWDSNTFFPERLSFAFSDTLLGFAPLGMIGSGVSAAILRYNIVFTLAFALAFLGAYALARQLGAWRSGAVVAAAAFAYAPWRWGQAGHLHVLSSGGIVLALAMLARGHGFTLRHGYRPADAKPGWALAGWLVAAWQISLGFGIGLPFAYVLALLAVVALIAWFVVPRRVVTRHSTPEILPAGLETPTPALAAPPPTTSASQVTSFERPEPQTSPYARPTSAPATSPYARPTSPYARPTSTITATIDTAAKPTDATPTDGAPTDGAPTNSAPTDGAPTNSAPTDGAPTNGAPTDVAATTVAPTDSALTDSALTDSAPGTGQPPTAQPTGESTWARPDGEPAPAKPNAEPTAARPHDDPAPAQPQAGTHGSAQPSGTLATPAAGPPTNGRSGRRRARGPELQPAARASDVIDFGPVRPEPSQQPARPARPAGPFKRWLARRPPFPKRLLGADVLGGIIFAAVGVFMAIPYLRVVNDHPYARRGVNELDIYSPPAYGFVTAPAESWLWGHDHSGLRTTMEAPNEGALLIGFVLLGLALAGLLYSVWSYQVRFLLLVAMIVSAVLAMGTAAPFGGKFSYLPLHSVLPGWDGIRTPGRLVLWTTLFAGLLAAGAVSAFVERARDFTIERGAGPYPGPLLRMALLLPLVLVLVEGISASPHPEVPRPPAGLSEVQGPMLVLPSDQLSDEMIMLWTTDGFPSVVNGGSGFIPARLDEVREVAATFPDPASVELLRGLGVRSVVVVKSMVAGTDYEPTANPGNFPDLDPAIEVEDTPELVIYNL